MENLKIADKGLLQTAELYEYFVETSVYPRGSELLKELRVVSSRHPLGFIGTDPVVGQFNAMILRLINAKKTIEVGVFTGYSLLLTALNISDDGKIIAIDIDRSAYEIGLPIIEKAGVSEKITFFESEALPVLDQILEESESKESFDFAFVDADKINYSKYHERLLELLKPGGIVVYDNTLWEGTVAMPESSVPKGRLASRGAAIEFNKFLANDSRVQICQGPLGDGITVCRRL